MENKTFEWEIWTEAGRAVVKTPEEALEALKATPAWKVLEEAEEAVKEAWWGVEIQ